MSVIQFSKKPAALSDEKDPERRRHFYLHDEIICNGKTFEVLSAFPIETDEDIPDKLKYLITGRKYSLDSR